MGGTLTFEMFAYMVLGIPMGIAALIMLIKSIILFNREEKCNTAKGLFIGAILIIAVLSIWLGWVRYTLDSRNDPGYVDTGKMIYYDHKEKYGQWCCFVLDNEQYVSFCDDTYVKETVEDIKLGDPVVNIQDKTTCREKFFGFNNAGVLYDVKNNTGCKLLADEGGSLYCKLEDIKTVEAYYDDLDNYDFYIFTYMGTVADDFQDKDKEIDRSKIDSAIIKSLINTNTPIEKFKTSENEKVEQISIAYVSKDNILEGMCLLANLNSEYYFLETWYETEESEDTIWECRALSEDLSDYLKKISKKAWEDN